MSRITPPRSAPELCTRKLMGILTTLYLYIRGINDVIVDHCCIALTSSFFCWARVDHDKLLTVALGQSAIHIARCIISGCMMRTARWQERVGVQPFIYLFKFSDTTYMS